MTLNPDQKAELKKFPHKLQELLTDEINAGNEVLEVSHGHPAAPVGANAILKSLVTTRPHATADGLQYRVNNGSNYSGSFTDEVGHFFILEPPDPNAGSYPDMDAIREKLNSQSSPFDDFGSTREAYSRFDDFRPAIDRGDSTPFTQFLQSMQINYEQWHDGQGYDIGVIESVDEATRHQIEDYLVHRTIRDWRDVEALAAINSPRTQALLRSLMKTADCEIKLWVLQYAPELVDENEKTTALIEAIAKVDIYHGLTGLLELVQQCHPRPVINALLNATLNRPGGVACHMAAMLLYLHGKAAEPFDWNHRLFFLRFNTTSRHEREAAFEELCDRIDVDSSVYLSR